MMKENRKIIFLLITILIISVFLRFYHISEESLWTDEMVSLNHIKSESYGALINSVKNAELTPPGFFIILRPWVQMFGTSELSLRFIPILFDILSILLIFFLGKKLFGGKVGLISSLILATTMQQIIYAQEFRHYSAFGFLTLLSTYLLIKTYMKISNLWILYVTTNVIMLYFNYMGIFILVLHSLIIYYLNKKEVLKRLIKSHLFTLILFIPGLIILYKQTLIRQPLLMKNLILRGVPQSLSNLGIGFYLIPLIFLFFFLIILSYFIKSKKITEDLFSNKYYKFGIYLIYIIFIILNIIFFDTLSRSFALIRHSYFIFPFFIILFSNSLKKIKRKKIILTILIIIILINMATLYFYYTSPTKPEWKKAVYVIESYKEISILFDRTGTNLDSFDYYSNKKHNKILLSWDKNHKLYQIEDNELKNRLSDKKEFWLVSSRNYKTRDYYIEFLDKTYEREYSKELKDISIYRYYNYNNDTNIN